jgi:hypothetical protein
LESAVDATVAKGRDVSYDLKQDRNDLTAKSTSEVADALVWKLPRDHHTSPDYHWRESHV